MSPFYKASQTYNTLNSISVLALKSSTEVRHGSESVISVLALRSSSEKRCFSEGVSGTAGPGRLLLERASD